MAGIGFFAKKYEKNRIIYFTCTFGYGFYSNYR